MRNFFFVLGLLLALAAGCVGGALWILSRGLPQVMALEEFRPASSTLILAADSSVIGEFAVERRRPVDLSRMPKDLIDAILAIEDHRYFEHPGVNVLRTVKAVVVDILEGEARQGGSTITQQLAKILFLTPEKTISRKIREAMLALEIERLYTKEEILGFYLNQIYLGNGAYGVAAAAELYFGKQVETLSLEECALIAALPKSPGTFDPFRAPDKALERRNLVLSRMVTLGWITEDRARAARSKALPVTRTERMKTKAPYFVEAVRRELVDKLGQDLVMSGGLKVYTTLDPELQSAAEKALKKGIEAVAERNKGRKSPLQGAVIALDPKTGAVLAHIGGTDWQKSQFDRARQAHRQMGSTFKPVVYAAAIEEGHSQADILYDSPVSLPGARPGEPWEPQNYDREFLGPMTMRKALALSRNLPVVRLAKELGPGRIQATALRLGLDETKNDGLAISLGTGSSTLEKTTAAYAAFVNDGLRPEPWRIRAVYGPDGRSFLDAPPPPPRRALTPEVAYIVSDMLREVVDSGTGQSARALPFRVAGKTGTTDDQRDAAFIGLTSKLALGVWMGRDDMSPIGVGETGARATLPVWIDVALAASEAGIPPPWPMPPTVELGAIDLWTGALADSGCIQTALAAFPVGKKPKNRCLPEIFGGSHPAPPTAKEDTH